MPLHMRAYAAPHVPAPHAAQTRDLVLVTFDPHVPATPGLDQARQGWPNLCYTGPR